METRDGDVCFPKQVPHRIKLLPGSTSPRLFALIDTFTKKVTKAASQQVGYYPRDMFMSMRVSNSEKFTDLHFHEHTIDLQEQGKIVRVNVGRACVELLGMTDGVDYTLRAKHYLFTPAQAQEVIARLGQISLGDTVYSPRLLSSHDIAGFVTLYGGSLGVEAISGVHRHNVLRLLNLEYETPYILADDKALIINAFKKENEKGKDYLGVVSSLKNTESQGLLRVCLDKVTS